MSRRCGPRGSSIFQRWVVTAVTGGLALVVAYSTSTFVLRSFPYTRPWGESMSHFLLMTSENLALSIANAIPGLFTVALIFVLARFVVRAVGLWFNAVERGRVRVRWLYPETAQPTRRLVTALLWLFAIVMAYPYLPGSQTDAFKGVSVFIGLIVTFGSSGLVNQIMSGFMITYSRALRVGDFVQDRRRPGDGRSSRCSVHEGEDRLERRGHDSERRRRGADDDGLFAAAMIGGRLHADVGDDWLRRAVASGARAAPAGGRADSGNPPRSQAVWCVQEGLQDFYVKYTLLVCLERQETRPLTMNALHATIQDVFNEYGVQIMSPNYMLDPAAPKVVAKKDWFAPPADAERLPKS